jgi:hypothetical protein
MILKGEAQQSIWPAHLSTTQMYLGKISDSEAMRWIENIYA